MLSIHQISRAYSIPEDDVEFTLMTALKPGYFDLTEPCWLGGPRKFRIGRKTENPLRAIGHAVLGEPLHDMWRMHRKCSSVACRNPLHYELKQFWDPNGVTEPKDLPE